MFALRLALPAVSPLQAALGTSIPRFFAAAAPRKAASKKKKEGKFAHLPAKPRRPGGAFALFVGQEYSRLKQANPDLTATQVMKEASIEWKATDDATRQRFKDMVKANLDQFHRDKAEWEEKYKKPSSNGYSLFIKQEFADERQGNESAPEVVIRLSARWNNLSDAEKAIFRDRATREYAEYKDKVGASSD